MELVAVVVLPILEEVAGAVVIAARREDDVRRLARGRAESLARRAGGRAGEVVGEGAVLVRVAVEARVPCPPGPKTAEKGG